jgi:hypothetical protein
MSPGFFKLLPLIVTTSILVVEGQEKLKPESLKDISYKVFNHQCFSSSSQVKYPTEQKVVANELATITTEIVFLSGLNFFDFSDKLLVDLRERRVVYSHPLAVAFTDSLSISCALAKSKSETLNTLWHTDRKLYGAREVSYFNDSSSLVSLFESLPYKKFRSQYKNADYFGAPKEVIRGENDF